MEGSMQCNEEKGAEKLMDDHLKSIGLHRKKIAKDGSCLFRAVAEQVLHCQSLHTEVRAKCVDFLRENRESYCNFMEGDFESYLLKLQDPQYWVGEVEINALAVMYKRDFLIFQEPGKQAVHITDNNFKDKVRLCFLNGNHYDSVYPVSRIKDAALCQSILYELLYDDVFKVDRSSLSMCNRSSRPSDLLSDDLMNACASSDESDLDSGDAPWVENGTSATAARSQSHRGRGRGRHSLPERVRRSLNPTLFRNVEYDIWHKTKRAQQKMDYCIAAGMQFTAGDRCQVRLEGGGRSYNATIKEVPPNNGPVMVYIEELAKKKQVPLWSLRPPCEESSWSTVVNRDRRLSNGHGEWEERGRGRGRGKHIPASSSSVPPVTAPGSGGRVQKQHSWPQQTTVEEQGGAKTCRKSMSLVESAFGLTETQRLAREEEERNVALVEIQLRDELSFPALRAQAGLQGDGAKKKAAEKKRSQRNKTKSPDGDVRAPSPSAGERPESSTPPLTSIAAANTAPPTRPAPPAAKPPAAPSANSDSNHPSFLSSIKASTPNINMAAAAPSTNPPGAVPPSVPSSATLFLTPALPAASSPPTPLSSPSPPPSSHPHKSSASPPLSSSPLPPPTFIAPIAPSPAAQGFPPPSCLPRSSSPGSSLPHSPSPSSFSSSLPHQAAHALEAPQNSSPKIAGTLTASQNIQSQTSHSPPQVSQSPPQVSQSPPQVSQCPPQGSLTSLTQGETHTLPPDTQITMPQMQSEAQSRLPPLQHQPHAEVASLPPSLPQASVSPPQSQHLSQSLCEVVQSSPFAPAASYPPTSQACLPVSVTQPHLPHPHPSQIPHPSVSLATSYQSQSHTPPSLPPTQPHPESPAHTPSLPPHPQSAPPPHQSMAGAVPLQQLSQLYEDPLYPGFPQGEKGDMAQTPLFSTSRSGDDLPRDVNILKFFFNLGVKAYSMPLFPPYVYLLPLQHAHTMKPKPPSRSPSPPPHYPPSRHQEAYQPHPQYPLTSASMPPQYDHQAALADPPHPSDSSFNQAGYPITQPPPHRMPWQPHQMAPPRNPNYTAGYPNPNPSYRTPPPLSQGYHPPYPQYPPSSLGYQASSHEELQGSQWAMEQRQPTNGDTFHGQVPGRVPGPLESPAAANMANANMANANMANANKNIQVVVPGFAHKKERGDSLTRAVLLVDPPLNNTPIIINDVSMTTMKPCRSPGSPSPYDIISETTASGDNNRSSRSYRGHRKQPNPYFRPGPREPCQGGYLTTVAMAESLSVSCSTEDDWEDPAGFKPTTLNRGQRRHPRGGRGRGSHDPGRGGQRRRPGGEAGFNFVQFNSSHRGRGREREY